MPLVPQVEPIFIRNPQIINNTDTSPAGGGIAFNQYVVPSWNLVGRPKKARIGTVGFNLETNCLEFWSGIRWYVLPMKKVNVIK
jgi:hypothetical protein